MTIRASIVGIGHYPIRLPKLSSYHMETTSVRIASLLYMDSYTRQQRIADLHMKKVIARFKDLLQPITDNSPFSAFLLQVTKKAFSSAIDNISTKSRALKIINTCLKIFLASEKLIRTLLCIKYLFTLLKRTALEIISFQRTADDIHNRVSRSPTPSRREPPVGGIKIGGEDGLFRHVAGTLYQEGVLTLKHAA